MKNQFLLIVCFLLMTTLSLNAQITEQAKTMSQGVQNALVLELPNANDRFINKLWKKYLKDFKGGKSKKNRKADELFTDNIKIPDIADGGTVDLYSRVAEDGDDVYLTLWVDLEDSYLSSSDHPDKYVEGEKLLMRFALQVTKEKIKIEIDNEEDKLKKIEKTLKKLERANDNYHREIEQAKEKIKKAEDNIVENETDQDNTRVLIEEQKEAVRKVRKKLEDM